MSKLSHEEFLNRAKVNNNVEILSEFNGFNKKIKCRCKIHNIIYETFPASILKNVGCKLCKRDRRITSLVGQRFGRLIVKEISDKTSGKRNKLMYKCICDCGNECDVSSESLKQGTTMSCGCLYKETRCGKSKANTYNLTDYPYGVGYCDNGTSFIFDKEDYDKIKNYCWFYDGKYVVTHSHTHDDCDTDIIRMHRFILGLTTQNDEWIDHINTIRYDNRKSNLRLCTPSENACNKDLRHLSSSGVVGVRLTNSNKWNSSIKYNSIVYNLGNYDSFEDAVMVRQNAEKKLFKEFAFNPQAVESANVEICL